PGLVSANTEHPGPGGVRIRSHGIRCGGAEGFQAAWAPRRGGLKVEGIVRKLDVHWLDQKLAWLKSEANPVRRLFYPPTDVGPPGLNWIVATPGLFRRLPFPLQEKVAYRSIRPAGAGWLLPRVGGVRLTAGCAL